MASPTIPIDPNGDLTLNIGAGYNAKSFLVSSKTLSLASPVWRAMLSTRNGFKEASSEEVAFPDDDPEALHIVLLACHLRFQEIPKTVHFKKLMNLCTVCDKYDCVALLQPWLSAWKTPWLHRIGERGYEGWVFIAWVTGDVDVFKRATDAIVLKCTTNKLGQCLTKNGKEVMDQSLTHHGLADAMLVARSKTLSQVIDTCHKMIRRYLSDDPQCCTSYEYEEECDALMLGFLVKPLHNMQLWPGDPKQIASNMPDESVENVVKKIEQIKCYTYEEPTSSAAPHHKCGFTTQLHESMDKIVKHKAKDVLELNRKHLEVQKAKLEPLTASLSSKKKIEALIDSTHSIHLLLSDSESD